MTHKLFRMHTLWIAFVCALLFAAGSTGCSTYEECTGDYADTNRNPNGAPCSKPCHCSNQGYEGVCIEGTCKSRVRGTCQITGDIRGCTLIVPKEGTTCMSGSQECNPQIFKDRSWPKVWSNCQPLETITKEENTKALCLDGINNDCDDKVDLEEPSCAEYCRRNDTRSCYTGAKGTANVGACSRGVEYCGPDNKWLGQCVDQVIPREEVCNGKDDDCDGEVDEDLKDCVCTKAEVGKKEPCYTGPTGTDTQGVCRVGTRTCEQTKDGQYRWGTCTGQSLPKDKEECNGLDDNCNGIVDEGCPCQEPAQRSCGQDIGECQQGTQLCERGTWSSICAASVKPRAELCDRRDNDCNGRIDDNLVRTCQTACGKGTETCQDGSWTGCTAPAPKPEECNNKDDNCDGRIDEGLSKECATDCGKGVQLCNAGKWSDCVPTAAPPETCNGKDDDCDGLTDEGLVQTCQTKCGRSVSVCENGKMTACSAPTPKPELCNGIDDDCNGKVDDIADRNCQNDCGTGTQSCKQGEWSACSAPAPQSETCNNKDDDCDGEIDEQLFQGCSTACGKGFQQCKQGKWEECSAPKPKTETCNGIDDNCDGQIDENITRNCTCDSKSGTQTCQNGTWSTCSATSPEVCDNADNDCDGDIDEGVRRTCQTLCGNGFQFCLGGVWLTCTAPMPSLEVCDGIDNDCDGQIDENAVPCVTTIAGTVGQGGFADGKPETAKFNQPQHLTWMSGANDGIFVSDTNNHRIRQLVFDANKNITGVSTIAGTGTAGYKNGAGSQAQLNLPGGMVGPDENDAFRFVDTGNNRIRKLAPVSGQSTFTISDFAGTGTAGFKNDTAANSLFNKPTTLFALSTLDFLILDTGNHMLRAYGPSGNITTVAGSTTSGNTDGKGTAARFKGPQGIADNFGTIYVADTENHVIKEIDLTTGNVVTIAGSGTAGYKDDTGKSAQFNRPTGLAVDGNGDILVADTGNHSIRLIKIVFAGAGKQYKVSTLAGTAKAGHQDAPPNKALFQSPTHILFDGNTGHIYVSDSGNNVIRKIVLR